MKELLCDRKQRGLGKKREEIVSEGHTVASYIPLENVEVFYCVTIQLSRSQINKHWFITTIV